MEKNLSRVYFGSILKVVGAYHIKYHNFFNDKICNKLRNLLKNYKKGGEFSIRLFYYVNIRIKMKIYYSKL